MEFEREFITPEIMHELLICDYNKGILIWKERPVDFFAHQGSCDRWNFRYAHKPAFASLDTRGYFRGYILENHYAAHRVIWSMYHNELPSDTVDHIDTIKTNNYISNLQILSNADQQKNRPMSKNNTSGYVGVNKNRNSWTAKITVDRKRIHLGSFEKIEDAIAARKVAEKKYGFSEYHGLPK